MADKIEFVTNYKDLSSNKGFQFEFCCNRCGTGIRTRFKPSVVGSISSALDAASSLFGGVFGSAADIGERVRSASWEKAHDEAFEEAIRELKPDFIQCPRCSTWVCRKSCWNTKRGLCKGCAPDLGVEMSAAQASVRSKKFGPMPKWTRRIRNYTKETGEKLLGLLVLNAKLRLQQTPNSAPNAEPDLRKKICVLIAGPHFLPKPSSVLNAGKKPVEILIESG